VRIAGRVSSDRALRASVATMMIAVRSEAGMDDTLTALHREHYRSLVKLASILVDDVGTGEEIVQDAFVSVFRSSARVRDEAKLPAYLRSAVLNGARSHLRKREVRNRLRVYKEETEPLLTHYDGLVVSVDGIGEVEEVNQRALRALGR